MDIQSALAIYANSFDNLPSTAVKAMAKPAYVQFADMLANAAITSDDGVYSMLQSTFERDVQLLTIEQLIKSAPLSMQRQLDSGALARFVTDSDNGFAVKFPLLLTLPDVAMFSDGSMSLLGGNHRLAFIVNTLLSNEVDEDTILAQQIQCLVTSVNHDAFRAALGESANALTDTQIEGMADKTLQRLWGASNGSRKVTASEAKEYDLYKDGVPRTLEGITAAFQQGNIAAKDAFVMVAPIIASDVNPPEVDNVLASVFPQDIYRGGYAIDLNTNTVAEILKSAWAKTGGAKQYSKAVKQDGMIAIKAILSQVFGVGDYDTTVYCTVTDEQGNAVLEDGIEKVAPTVIDCSLFQHALDTVLASLAADGNPYEGNIARNKAAIGAKIAELLANTQLFSNYEERSAATVKGKVTVKKAVGWNF